MKPAGSKFKTNKKTFFFTQCVIQARNSLPPDVETDNLARLKKKGLDKFLDKKVISSYWAQDLGIQPLNQNFWDLKYWKLQMRKTGKNQMDLWCEPGNGNSYIIDLHWFAKVIHLTAWESGSHLRLINTEALRKVNINELWTLNHLETRTLAAVLSVLDLAQEKLQHL